MTAHLAVASPPLFTLIGVAFYLMGVPNGDHVLWGLMWIPLAVLTVAGTRTRVATKSDPHRLASPTLRTAHGVSAATILLIFLVPHVANHLTAIWSVNAHMTVMRDSVDVSAAHSLIASGQGLHHMRSTFEAAKEFAVTP
jgi:hypothetical protein